MAATTYKLTYFTGRGRAELARLIFAAADVKYEDVRIEQDKWPAAKTELKLPFGQIPILEVDGVTLCQSITIARFLARRFNLVGKNDLEQARADMVIDSIEDIANELVAIVFRENDKAKQAEKKQKFVDEGLPKFLTNLEKLLNENKGGAGYFVGDNLTWADIGLVNGVSWLSVIGADDQVAKYPKLKALVERVKALPKIAAWLQARPQTPW